MSLLTKWEEILTKNCICPTKGIGNKNKPCFTCQEAVKRSTEMLAQSLKDALPEVKNHEKICGCSEPTCSKYSFTLGENGYRQQVIDLLEGEKK